jgi:N-acetylglutamate synthase-like GNAT family acetyltransferase
VSDSVSIRRELRAGDLDRIVSMHGRVYSRENGVDSTFEEMVAAAVARAASQGFPRHREGIWIIERGGSLLGSLAFTDEGDDVAMVRWVLLDPALRGMGLGRRLLGELLVEVEALGYSMVCLETFSELRTAAHLYRAHGFEVIGSETGPRWGRDEITYQRYERELPHASSGLTSIAAGARSG